MNSATSTTIDAGIGTDGFGGDMGGVVDTRTSTSDSGDTGTDAATGTDTSVGDIGGVTDPRTSTSDSGDNGDSGPCGSQVVFKILPLPGVDPNSFCSYGCYGLSTITFTSAFTQLTADDIAQPTCVPLCDECDGVVISGCHSCPSGFPLFLAVDFHNYSWDGSYFTKSTCGGGKVCQGPQLCASAGHYTGEFCALRGSVSGNYCTPLQEAACTTVEFDLPSTATIAVELGP